MIEIYLKYDNMYTFGVINAFICINNHVNSCINNMLSIMHNNKIFNVLIYINNHIITCIYRMQRDLLFDALRQDRKRRKRESFPQSLCWDLRLITFSKF